MVYYLCQHPEIKNDVTTLLTKDGRQMEILIDGNGFARQTREHDEGYTVATRRVEEAVAQTLQEAKWAVRPMEEDEGLADEMAMLGGGHGVGLAFQVRGRMSPDAKLDAQQLRLTNLEARFAQVQAENQQIEARVAQLEARFAGSSAVGPVIPNTDGEEFRGIAPETREDLVGGPEALKAPMPRNKRGRFGGRAVTDEALAEAGDETVAGAAPKAEALAEIGG